MRTLAMALAAILIVQPLTAAEREVIRTGWPGFRTSSEHLKGRSVRVRLAGGGEVKTKFVEATENGMVVRSTRAIKQWSTTDGKALIPRDQVASVRFGGKLGHRGLIGGLTGFGAGAAIAAGTLTNTGCIEGTYCLIVLPVLGVVTVTVGAVAGYFIGKATAKPAPEFVLSQ